MNEYIYISHIIYIYIIYTHIYISYQPSSNITQEDVQLAAQRVPVLGAWLLRTAGSLHQEAPVDREQRKPLDGRCETKKKRRNLWDLMVINGILW